MSISLRKRIFYSLFYFIFHFLIVLTITFDLGNGLLPAITWGSCVAIGIFIATDDAFTSTTKSAEAIFFYKMLFVILLGTSIVLIRDKIMNIPTYSYTLYNMCVPFALGLFSYSTRKKN